MIKSMTGFGQGILENDRCRITVDIKTVNNRFLDIHTRIPADLISLESGIKKRIQAVLKRGRVDLTCSVMQTADVNYELNMPLIKGYVNALRRLQDDLAVTGEIDLSLISRLPNAIQPPANTGSIDAVITEGVMTALDRCLEKLVEMRINEGNALAAELNTRLYNIETALPNVEINADQLISLYQERLLKRIQELTRNTVQIDEGRLAQEVAYLAERSDITEEITRLKSHIVQFRAILATGDEAGKKLDFLLQEMNREATTILSKSGELSISRIAIEIKSEVEKLREQVQNVE